MTLRNCAAALIVALGVVSGVRADMIGPGIRGRVPNPPIVPGPIIGPIIGPTAPRPLGHLDTINSRLFTEKDLSDFVIFACRSDRAPEQITISDKNSTVLQGGAGLFVWLAAVPKDDFEKLGEEKVMKVVAKKHTLEGVVYSQTLSGSVAVGTPGVMQTHTNNYEVTIDNKKVSLHSLSETQVNKKFGKGSGSGSGSKQIIWPITPSNGNDPGEPPFWTGDRLRFILAGALLSMAVALSGIWLARRRFQAAPVPA